MVEAFPPRTNRHLITQLRQEGVARAHRRRAA